jgi:exopolysaccharide biosynthesis polyprenyl glycosylphosphotransferase
VLAWQKVGFDPIVVALAFAGLWVGSIALQDLYRLRARLTSRREVLDFAKAGVLAAFVTFGLLFLVKMPEVSRLFLIALFPIQTAATIASRLLLRAGLSEARARGMNTRYVLVVGTGTWAEDFADRLERHRELGLRVIGHLRQAEAQTALSRRATQTSPERAVRRPILGDVDDLEMILHNDVVDEVAICLPPAAWGLIEAITRLCEDEGKVVRIPLSEGGFDLPGAMHEVFEGIPVLSLVYGPDRALSLFGKRALDLALSAIALVVLSPLILAVALVIRATDGSPVFFSQPRIGLHGRVFRVLKFRTMVPDAEELLDDLIDQNEISGHAFKLTEDPRTTRTGGWLRRLSIDELPQLVNVLKGEMSLVGPRPPLPREVAAYDVWHRRRLSMKPGITGLWQVTARREGEFDRWVALDLDYIDRWSLWLDIKIMARTIPALIQGR